MGSLTQRGTLDPAVCPASVEFINVTSVHLILHDLPPMKSLKMPHSRNLLGARREITVLSCEATGNNRDREKKKKKNGDGRVRIGWVTSR